MHVTEQQKQQIRNLLIRGRKIEAIKFLRESFGLSLREAKLLAEKIDDTISENEYQYDRSKSSLPQGCRTKGCKGGCIGIIFMIIGSVLLAITLIGFYLDQSVVNEGVSVTAIVIENPRQPVFEYSYKGKTYHYESVVSSEPPDYVLGEEVMLFIDPDNPENVVVNTFTERWLVVVIIGFIGMVFFGIGFVVFRVHKKSS